MATFRLYDKMILRHCSAQFVRLRLAEIMPSIPTDRVDGLHSTDTTISFLMAIASRAASYSRFELSILAEWRNSRGAQGLHEHGYARSYRC